MHVQEFVAKWAESGAAERANKDPFLLDLCDTLGVEKPRPATGDPDRDLYVFERPAILAKEKGASVGRMDLFKTDCFILEAKQGSGHDSKKLGHAKRGTPAWNIAMRDAYGQALGYAHTLDNPPPFILTTDIGYCFEFYSSFDGSGVYRAFPNAQKNRVYLKDLPQHVDTLRAVFTDPYSLDPSRKATKVTREVAAHLAELARSLEEAKHPPERVAKFLMRCIFTMFAEDVGMLPDSLFTTLLRNQWLLKPGSFPKGIQSLWKAMNDGSEYVVGKLLRFNGGLFKDPEALPLTAKQLLLLDEAAACDWSEVEPAIFGTLLERALDPRERHRLGAHYTPRAFVERLVRPTIEEPLRADWDLVRAEVRQLVAADNIAVARKHLLAFQSKLTKTRVLDPACGTGNFLYVTLDLMKRLEGEVFSMLSDIEGGERGRRAGLGSEREGWAAVTPQQFLGIEVKPWAKEIAELVLWIGYLQWHFRTHGQDEQPAEPVLHDFGNIECRDAVLAWDRQEQAQDDAGRPLTRWDGFTMKESAVTGEAVPDESARVPVYQFKNAREAVWPEADFIVGNPPFVGNKRMRATLGDGYVEALRNAYPGVPETSDFVMYWWAKAAHLCGTKATRRFGLITTNSITQTFNRRVVQAALEADEPVAISFALPDHPWADGEADTKAGAVRIAMTVADAGSGPGRLLTIASESEGEDGMAKVVLEERVGEIHADLSLGASILSMSNLEACSRLAYQGAIPGAEGFRLDPVEAAKFGLDGGSTIRRYVIGRDLMQKAEERYAIDFFGMTEAEARRKRPDLYQVVLNKVRPFVASAGDPGWNARWWEWIRPRPEMRAALAGLSRYIATCRTARHRVFQFLPGDWMPDTKLIVIATSDAFTLGVLSSRPHLVFAARMGGWLGVGNDATYNHADCFYKFAIPVCDEAARARVASLAEALDQHRKDRRAQFPDLTITGQYNVLEKVRAGVKLSAKEQGVHDKALVSVLRKLHDDLDAAVFDAYSWPHDLTDEQIIERLVKLNGERADEEMHGLVRWLRPDFQNPGGEPVRKGQVPLLMAAETVAVVSGASPWPKKLPERVAAVRSVFARGESMSIPELAAQFKGAKPADVEAVLRSLAALGLAISFEVDGNRRWRLAGRVAA